MSVYNGDSSVLSMSISKNESQLINDDDEDTTTAQTDREMFFHVVEYRQDIYEYMLEIEVILAILLIIFLWKASLLWWI